jgi:hypothetical protein
VPDLRRASINFANEPLSAAINERIERTLTPELPRRYLGASILHECLRQTQFDQWCRPLLPARVLSIFSRGHYFEAHTRQRLIDAGFIFAPMETCEFVALNGDLRGHADGVIIAAPALPGSYFPVPAIWEHKAINAKNFRAVTRDGFERVFPRYGAQIRLYQKFLGKLNPALVSVANADTCELSHFSLPYDAALAETWTERAIEIAAATRRGELLPRAYSESEDWRCRMCSHRERCWGHAASS